MTASDDDHEPSEPLPDIERTGALSLPARPRRVSRKGWLLAVSAVFVLAIFVAAREVLLPFILALVIAYVFTPSVLSIERRGVPRWVAIVGIYAITLGTMYGFGALAAPRIVAETKALAREVPRLLKHLQEDVIPAWEERIRGLSEGAATEPASSTAPPTSGSALPSSPVPDESKPALSVSPKADGSFEIEIGSGFEVVPSDGGGYRVEAAEARKKGGMQRALHYVERNYIELLRGGVALVSNVARGIFLFFMTLMLAAYLMLTHEDVIGFFRGLVRPPARADFDRLLVRVDRGLSGVVRGQLMICLVNGVLSAIGFALIGLKYWPVMALVAAVGSLIPIFGSILSSVPAVAIGLTQSPATAFLVLGWIVLIHQIEANFLNPKIIGTAAHLHPVLVVFVLLAGEHWYHAAGALLAVPCLSIAQSLFLHFREVADRDEVVSIDRTT
ncbi:MAG: AI-2E family transporter [Deltaproteobacteria bacterium]|nr:AI-2E family transporter [Deltaproteobacteria bacterium]